MFIKDVCGLFTFVFYVNYFLDLGFLCVFSLYYIEWFWVVGLFGVIEFRLYFIFYFG